MTVQAKALPECWQVQYEAGGIAGVADTAKRGAGGGAGLRPHELLEASLACCMTIMARLWLDDEGLDDEGVGVTVEVVREADRSRFLYSLRLPAALEPHRDQILARLESSAVRATLSKQLTFEPVELAQKSSNR